MSAPQCTRSLSVIRRGLFSGDGKDLYKNKYKFIIAEETNRLSREGTLADAMLGADVFIGVSGPEIVTEEMIRSMNKDADCVCNGKPGTGNLA